MKKKQVVEELQEEKNVEQPQEEKNVEQQQEEKNVEQPQEVEEDKKNEAMADLEKQILALEEENKKLVDQVKRTQAELINYRTRKDKEVSDLLKYSNQKLITDLVPIIDNFERAIKLDDNNLTDELSKFLVGFKMIYSSLASTLKNYGVEEISRQGQIFDPSLEQALLTDHVEEMENEAVIEVLQKGYKLYDRVIRAASVKVNQK